MSRTRQGIKLRFSTTWLCFAKDNIRIPLDGGCIMSLVTNITNMEKPNPYPDDETTTGGWEHEPSRFKRLGGFLLNRIRGGAWAELPVIDKPVAAIVEYPHELELCDPPELGGQHKGVGIPDRTDGTRPRAV
jgi:hypothetical protein